MASEAGQCFGDRYRVFDEGRIIETMLLEGHAYEADLAVAREKARAALRRFVELGLGFRISGNGPLYDPVEVVCFAKSAGRRGEDGYWESHYVPTLRRFVTDFAASRPAKVAMRYTRSFNAARFPAGETRRLRMPLPLALRFTGVEIHPELPDEAISHVHGDGRLEVRITPGTAEEIRIGARIELTLAGVRAEDAPDPEIYLRPKEGLIVVSTEVEALARHLAGAEPDHAAVRAFWSYLIEQFTFCPVHYDQVSAEAPLDWVLQTRIYDCQLASALLVGLCRARGIPARMVGGNFLYRLSPTNHFWAEVWMGDGGWTPMDFICWDLSRGGQDADWADRFCGQLDARLITECLPRSFTGAPGVTVPDDWVMLRTMREGGAEMTLCALDGRPIYRDSVEFI